MLLRTGRVAGRECCCVRSRSFQPTDDQGNAHSVTDFSRDHDRVLRGASAAPARAFGVFRDYARPVTWLSHSTVTCRGGISRPHHEPEQSEEPDGDTAPNQRQPSQAVCWHAWVMPLRTPQAAGESNPFAGKGWVTPGADRYAPP